MRTNLLLSAGIIFVAAGSFASAQSKFEESLCEAAKDSRVIELVYDKDKSKGCLPRVVDVHQLAVGNNGKLYMHGYQHRGCAKSNDRPAERVFRLDKVVSVKVIEGSFSAKSKSIKTEGWDGCLGDNCYIEQNICE